jgi:hypothetical protein
MSSDLRFTQAQRWDLLRMSGAALVSTIFFAVPMFVSRPDSAHLQEKPTSVADKSARAGTQPAAPRDTEVSVVVSEAVAQVTVPAFEGSPIAAPRPARVTRHPRRIEAPPRVDQRADAERTSTTPLARRLGRLIAGTGRYEVRPFPTVTSPGS